MAKKYIVFDGNINEGSLYNINILKANSNYIYDIEGKEYLDLRSGLWNVSLGYEDDIYQKVQNEYTSILKKKIPYIDINSYDHDLYDELADMILTFIDNKMAKCTFTNSGSENTELALKIANKFNKNKDKKNNILAFKNSYHGSFFGGSMVSGIDSHYNTGINNIFDEVTFIDFPQNKEEETAVLEYLGEIIHKYNAFFIEPILASAGVYYANYSFFDELLILAKNNNVLTIFDEVATGFYRSGKKLYTDYLKHSPNIISLSKSLNNGISPFGCLCMDDFVYQNIKDTNIYHFSTQNGNLLSVVSAKIVVQYYLENEEKINEQIKGINLCMKSIMKKIDNDSYRICGCMLSISTKEKDPFIYLETLKKLGILTYIYANEGDNGLSVFPQYNINLKKLQKALLIIIKQLGY